MTAAGLSNPILNSPYAAPEQHFELGPDGPTGTVPPRQEPSGSFIPKPAVRLGRGKAAHAVADVQTTLDFDVTGERRQLERHLKAEIHEGLRATRYRTESIPFPKPSNGRIAIKVINDCGDEVLQVFEA